MKPFDLMAAINGDKVVTREGNKVILRNFFINSRQIVGEIINQESEFYWNSNGKVTNWEKSKDDLFMAPKKKKLSIAVSKKPDKDGNYIILSSNDMLAYALFSPDKNNYQFIEIEIDDE